MKQNPNPKMPDMGKAVSNNSAVTEQKELICQLENRSTKSVMLSEKKREFLKILLKNKKVLIQHCDLFDGITNSSLGPSMRKLIPPNDCHVDKSVNAELAIVVAKLLPPLQILRSHIVSQYELESSRKGNLRDSTKEKQHCTIILVVLDEADETLQKLEDAVYKRRSALLVHSVSKPIKLSDQQQERKWSADNIPTQKYLRKCPACNYQSTN